MRATIRRLSVCLASFLGLAVSALAAAPFSIDDVMSAPFPSDLVSAPSGAVAWVFNASGVRNVWVAEPPAWKARPLTSWKEDDGQEIGDLAFSPDGKTLVFVRGGDANRAGEIPNPAHAAEGAEQAVWAVSLAGGDAPRRLGEGHGPAVSLAGGGRVAWVVKGQIWSAPLDPAASEKEKPTALFKSRGEAAFLRWSPDGSRLAFVTRRGDHGFVGVFEPATKTLRFLDPAVDRDDAPVWSPDGRRVAFLRVPANRSVQGFRPHHEGEPWSIRVADAGTGVGREVFRAERGRGSVFRTIVGRQEILWVDGDRLVFPWERDGWTHLYSIPASSTAGGTAVLLTPGEFEVEHVALMADRATVVYSSNQGDIDRRHVWRVRAAGGAAPIALTTGTGLEWEPVAAGDGAGVVFLRSDARKPPRPAIRTEAGAIRDLAAETIPASFPEASLVVPEAVEFAAADGVKIHAQLFRPAGKDTGKHPAAIFFHGGSRRQMLLGWHYMYYYRNSYAFNQYLASRGYVVLSVNYRSGIGYGMEFREAIDYGATGASEYRDVVGAGRYLRSRSDVDPARIALWGGSYGGYLTALGLARDSDLFAAGVDFHGVHDWNDVIRNFEPTYDPAKSVEIARLAFESSPLASVSTWRSPVLLIHGDDDRNVPFTESVALAEALRAKGVDVEQLVFPDEVHDFLRHASWVRAYAASFEFLERRLKPRRPG
jgi:dipeptidyl aminopeptidase/acylaminoacyl peptidase